jgi:hypothetical protein
MLEELLAAAMYHDRRRELAREQLVREALAATTTRTTMPLLARVGLRRQPRASRASSAARTAGHSLSMME